MTFPFPPPSRLVFAAAAAMVALAGPVPGWAQQPPHDRAAARQDARNDARNDARYRDRDPPPSSRNRDALSDSVRRFERSNRGSRVLSVERMQSDGRDVNRIKAMDDSGRVRVYVDDPQRRQPPRRPTRDDHD